MQIFKVAKICTLRYLIGTRNRYAMLIIIEHTILPYQFSSIIQFTFSVCMYIITNELLTFNFVLQMVPFNDLATRSSSTSQ